MNTKQLSYTAIFAAALACGVSTGAQAQSTMQALEGGALVNGFLADRSRDRTNDGFGFALDAVRLYDDYQGMSVRASFANLETDMPIETDFQRYTGTVGYWRYLDGDGLTLQGFRPYVNAAIGFGIQETVTTRAESDSGVLLEAAFGLVSTWDVMLPNLKFRPEARLDYEDVYGGVMDWTIGAGVHYSFGAPKMARMADPVPVAPAPRAVQPAPVVKPAVFDSDGDGVNDKDDVCPGSNKDTAVDQRGCVQIEKVVLKGVSFGSGSAVLKPEAFSVLRSVAAALNASPKLKVEVGGHSDAQGDDKKNQVLSEKRAQSVKSFLIKEGVAADRITIKGYGESKPQDTNDTPEGRSNNRRVEFKVLN